MRRDHYFPLCKVWWLREASQIGQTFIPLCEKKSFKTQHGRNPIDPAILAAIRHRFIAKRENLKGRRARRPETGNFFGGHYTPITLVLIGDVRFVERSRRYRNTNYWRLIQIRRLAQSLRASQLIQKLASPIKTTITCTCFSFCLTLEIIIAPASR